jgi:hypothetical protein
MLGHAFKTRVSGRGFFIGKSDAETGFPLAFVVQCDYE